MKRRRLAGIALLAFALRAGYSLHIPHNQMVPDAIGFDEIAWNLASQGTIGSGTTPTAIRLPSYITFLAAIYKMAGHHYTAVRMAQAVLGAYLTLLLFALTPRVTADPRAPWIAATLAAIYPFFIYYDSELIADSFLVFWIVMCLQLFYRWRDAPFSMKRAAACGLGFAILCLTKTIFIPFFVLLVSVEALRALPRSDRRLIGSRLILIAGLCALPIWLWGLRNKNAFGTFTLDTHGGRMTIETIMFYDECKRGTFHEFFENHPLERATAGMNEAQADAFYFQQTKQWIREHPARYLRQSLGDFKDFWRFYPRQDITFKEGRAKITIISLLTEPLLLLGGLLGIILTRKRWRDLYPIYLLILMLSTIHMFTTGQMRYRLPVMPFAIMFTTVSLLAIQPKSSDS
jgi:4-amino-4-deoxy-L-arabinose transferase-like glycosyltransferase